MVSGLDHPGLPGLQVDRAVNVDALTPARLLDRELLLARAPSSRQAAPHGSDARRPRIARPRRRAKEFRAFRSPSMKAFCFSSSSLRGMTFGL